MTIVKTDFHIDRAGPNKQSKPPGDENFFTELSRIALFAVMNGSKRKRKWV